MYRIETGKERATYYFLGDFGVSSFLTDTPVGFLEKY